MNRRTFIKAATASLAAFVLPAPRPRINLMEWCSDASVRWDMTLPWALEDWTYATDRKACVRVRPESGDVLDHEGKMPPFGSLDWDHDKLTGWKPLRPLKGLMAEDSYCPTCDGTGYRPGVVPIDCDRCSGTGTEWVGSDWDLSRPIRCRRCNGLGHVAPCEVCPGCLGNAIGTFPGIVRVQGHLFDAALYRKVQRLGAEAAINADVACITQNDGKTPLMRFRFDGGTGLLVGLHPCAESRIVK